MGLITRERIAIIVLGLCASAAIAGTTSYTYDEQGRVTSASYSDGTLACYEYDPADNRVVYTVASGGACFTPVKHSYVGPASGTETVPTGATLLNITMWSGGASGGLDSSDTGGGGGGGCQATQLRVGVASGNSLSYTAAGGAIGPSSNGLGTDGLPSSISGTVAGGSVSLSTTSVAGGGEMGGAGGPGAVCGGGTDTSGGRGKAVYGGAGGGLGGGAGGTTTSRNGQTPGGGGAGPATGFSGNGAPGETIFGYY